MASKTNKCVYHYTSQVGLMGILSGSIWATNLFYLNDSMEYKQAKNTFLKALLELKDKKINKTDKARKIFLEVCTDFFREDKKIPDTYVASFSAEPDLLSQWRAYTPPQGGYSIGLNKEKLRKVALENYCDFFECIYSEDEQYKIAVASVNTCLTDCERIAEKFELKEGITRLYTNLVFSFILNAAKFKDKSFAEEKEWRMVKTVLRDGDVVKFREGKSMITPYVEIPFKKSAKKTIEDIIVGPTPNIDLSVHSVQMLKLDKYRGNCFDVRKSSSPYRSW